MIYQRGEIWWVKLKWEGRVIRQSTGERDRAKATIAERKILKELAKGRWVERDPADYVLFEEVWEKYMADEAPLKASGTYDRAMQCAKNFLPVIGNLKLSAITSAVLSDYRSDRLKDGVVEATVNKELQFVRRVFSLCKGDWQLASSSPFETFKLRPCDNQLVRQLKPGQPEALLEACPTWLKPIVIVDRYIGFRRGNIYDLMWDNVNLDSRTVIAYVTKNGEPVLVPLADRPFEVLTSLHKEKDRYPDCPYVFHKDGMPLTPGQVTKAFERACKKAGIAKFRFHDLRHDFASNLAQKGQSLYHIQRLLGHKDSRMTQRYAHLRVDDLRKAVESLG
jgi:integrase